MLLFFKSVMGGGDRVVDSGLWVVAIAKPLVILHCPPPMAHLPPPTAYCPPRTANLSPPTGGWVRVGIGLGLVLLGLELS